MTRSVKRQGFRRQVASIGALALVLIAAGTGVRAASDDDEGPTGNSWTDKVTDSIQDYVDGARKKIGLNSASAPPPSEAPSSCPTIGILPGTEAQRVLTPGGSGNQNLKYQFSLMRVGRECAVSGSNVAIKIGANGRVLLGPAGAPGTFDVPIRVAVFSESQGKAVESRLFKVSVTLAADQPSMPFDFVSNPINVAIPSGRAKEYSIKVGIDPGKGGGEASKPKAGKRHKTAAAKSASE